MGDFLFDWAISKDAGSNQWQAARHGTVLRATSLDELREAVVDEETRDDPYAHIANLVAALRMADDECVLDRLSDQEDIDAIRSKVNKADAYLKRVAVGNASASVEAKHF